MKRLALLAVSTLILGSAAGCAERVVYVASPPPPPPAYVAPSATATVDVSVGPAPDATAEPEEVIATSEPPEMIYEEQDDMPGPGMYWVPGYWQWTGNDWYWYYGGWYAQPDGRVYVGPYYERVGDHVVYVRGYWGTGSEPPRYYGGDRIVFTAAVRPDGYVRGVHTPVPRSTGLPPGQRASYGPHPSGRVTVRAVPTATAPRNPVAQGAQHGQPGAAAAEGGGRVEGQAHVSADTSAKPESGATGSKPEGAPPEAARAEPRAAPKPQPKPAPKPRRK
jgi:hypothetical protein